MKSPKISIVIPSYNKVKYIGQTLKSIFDQDYKNFEVIIQDGGSTDGSLEIIEKYVKKYPEKIKFESKKDKGQLDAINRGLKKASGDILGFINADDLYLKRTFELLAKHFIRYNEALWFAGKGVVINENGKDIARFTSWYKNMFLYINLNFGLLVLNYLMQPSIFFTKKTYQKYGPFIGTSDFVMEYDMWLKIGKNKMPVVINNVLSKFRLEKDTKTYTNSKALLIEDEKIVKKYTKNKLIISLHVLNNYFRNLVLKAT